LPPHRVVTLAFLSESLWADLISEQIAGSLLAETQGSVVLVRFQDNGTQAGQIPPAHLPISLNGEFHMPAWVGEPPPGVVSITLSSQGEAPSAAGVVSLISQLRTRFQYVLIAAPAGDQLPPWLFEFVVRSDAAYLFLEPATADIYHMDLVVRGVEARARDQRVNLKPIACLAEREPIAGFDLFAEQVGTPIHLYLRGCPARASGNGGAPEGRLANSFSADVRRLAREISGRLVGLALASGAAKGFAHVGVIQVLEENGIEVDVVAGASMGAYVGSLWCFGCDGGELERLARELERRWALWTLVDPVFPPRRGFLRGRAVKRRLMRTLGYARFGDLVRPLRVVAGNLATLERVVFSSGEVATAVHASIAVPGICVPVTIRGETYIDGGIVDPLPVDVLREMGVTRVIAVNVIPTPDRIRSGLAGRGNGHRRRKPVRKVRPLDQNLNYFAPGNLFEILVRSIQGAQIRVAEASCRMADVVIRPALSDDDSWLDYRHPGNFIALGRQAAELHLDEIKALVNRKEVSEEVASMAAVA
jgi:NTE family protein